MNNNIDFTKTYSYSKLSLFGKCPKQYDFNYLDPEIAPIKKQFKKQKSYLTKGTAVHGAITLFHHLPAKERIPKNLEKCLLKAWFLEENPRQEPPLGRAGGFESLAEERRAYSQALALLNKFIRMENGQPKIFYLPSKDIKNSFSDYEEMVQPLVKEVFISGKFDRIDKIENGFIKIIDYKTGGKEQNQFQLYFYKLLAELNFKNKVGTVSFYYLNRGAAENFDVSNTTNKEIKKQILEIIEKIETTKAFSPKPNRMCNYCDFKEICPEYNSPKQIKKKIKEAFAEQKQA